jgi:hypothetical protein
MSAGVIILMTAGGGAFMAEGSYHRSRGAMIDPATLPFTVVYLALAIGAGSLVGSWMNDSAFRNLYDVLEPRDRKLKPAGEWNTGRVVAMGPTVEHYLNGGRVLS